jgi:hypothetical protein
MSKDIRQRAKQLGAADAGGLIKSSLPDVASRMNPPQIAQVQKVLDAAVVNPAIKKEADELYRKSVIASSGGYTNRDPALVARADELMQSGIRVTEADKHVWLDFERLLTPDALKTTTDNPDEAAFFNRVRGTLASEGVWLRFEHSLVSDPDDPPRRIVDHKNFEAWLSLGYNGDTIATRTGLLDRSALLGTTRLGAGYYSSVVKGGVSNMLEHALRRVLHQIQDGRNEHELLASDRLKAAPGVVGVSDLLGGADFPDIDMWSDPRSLITLANVQNVDGNVVAPCRTLFMAGVETSICAQRLADYIGNTQKGAQRAVKFLRVLKLAGKIAEVVLVVYAVFATLTRLLAAEALEGGAGAGLRALPPGGGAPPVTARYGAYNTTYLGKEAFAQTVEVADGLLDANGGAAGIRRAIASNVTLDTLPPLVRQAVDEGVMNAYRLAEQAANEEYSQGLKELMSRNASVAEKDVYTQRWYNKYGIHYPYEEGPTYIPPEQRYWGDENWFARLYENK